MLQCVFSKILVILVLFFAVKTSLSVFYPRVYKDFVITHGIFSIQRNLDWLSCIQDCMRTKSCLSYNYDIRGTENHVCELSKCVGVFNDGCLKKKLRFSRGFVYQQLKDKNMDKDSCYDEDGHPTSPLPQPIYYKDCADAMRSGMDADGLYSIDPDGRGMFSVQCDQTTEGGGWVIIQRRLNGNQDFFLGWQQYSDGFGRLDGEFWLGLDRIQRLASKGNSVLRIGLKNNKGGEAYALYENFGLTPKETKFRLNVTYTGGIAGDSLSRHSGKTFSTTDQDNDLCADCSCAQRFKSAWWYDGMGQSCLYSDLNGQYYDGISWSTWFYKITHTFMMIRPDNI